MTEHLSPRTAQQFATTLLAIVAKALESEASLDAVRADVEAIVKDFVGKKPEIVFKAVESRRMVYGWASVITKDGQPVTDRQGDVMDVDEFRDSVHDFVRSSRVGNTMHAGPQTHEILDSFVMDAEVQRAFGVDFGCEGWMVGTKVRDDAVWKRVQAGELRAFSIEGDGLRSPLP